MSKQPEQILEEQLVGQLQITDAIKDENVLVFSVEYVNRNYRHVEKHCHAFQQTEKEIFNLLNTEAHLRSKHELIEKFIQANLPAIEDTDDLLQEFEKFWNEEQQRTFNVSIVRAKYASGLDVTAKPDKVVSYTGESTTVQFN